MREKSEPLHALLHNSETGKIHNVKHTINVIKTPMMPPGARKAFELLPFFYKEFLSPNKPNRHQKVVTSGCEVITSGPEKCVKKRTSACTTSQKGNSENT